MVVFSFVQLVWVTVGAYALAFAHGAYTVHRFNRKKKVS